jgi:hypothetical protein
VRARRRLLAGLAAAWTALAILTNLLRDTFSPTGEQLQWLLAPPLVATGCVGVALAARRSTSHPLVRRVFDPFYGVVLLAVIAGTWIPVTLDVGDGLQALVNIARGLSGGGINAGIPLFQASLGQLTEPPLKQATAVFAIGLVAVVVGIWRKDPKPVVWMSAAAVLAVMAEARLAAVHYFAPAYVLSMFAALWLVQSRSLRSASLLVWPIVLYVALPAWDARRGPAQKVNEFAAVATPANAAFAARVQPGEVALVPSGWPFEDARYFELVYQYANYTPPYSYRTLPATVPAAELAAKLGLRLRYYFGPGLPETSAATVSFVGQLDVYTVRPVPGTYLVYELVRGPGADTLWQRPDARYDPWTGYYKDAAGRYWDAHDDPVPSPARRRYLEREHVWVDAYGDLWNAQGRHVGKRPDLRIAS